METAHLHTMASVFPPVSFKDSGVLLDTIGEHALTIAEQRYSSGFPTFKGGHIRKLGFNNRRHGEKVGNAAALLAEYDGLAVFEQRLAKTAGYAHDIVQLKGRGQDEQESADWLAEQLQRAGMPDETSVVASEAILGTLPLFSNGVISGQNVNHMRFSSLRSQRLALCVASADFCEFFTPTSPYLSHLLYVQRQGVDADQPPLHMDDLITFQKRQLQLLHTYSYPHKAAEKLFASHRKEVMAYNEFVLRQLEKGNLESWEQLLRQDQAFMHHPEESLALPLA